MASVADTAPRNSRPRQRMSADARRDQIIGVAAEVIARDGMHAASTAEIAELAGISQAYLFRLFPTKEELQIAVAATCGQQMLELMVAAGVDARARGEDPLPPMAQAWQDFLGDRTRLRVSLQAISAAESIPALGEALRASWEVVVMELGRVTGVGPDELRAFIAEGMLLKIIAGLGAEEADWVVHLYGSALPADVSGIAARGQNAARPAERQTTTS